MVKDAMARNDDYRSIVADVVDLFHPLFSPYTSDVYWYLLRHSVFQDGGRFVQASATSISKGIGTKHAYKTGGKEIRASDKTISDNLRLLENLGAIVRVSEPTREGTTFEVRLPREIAVCQERASSLAVVTGETTATEPLVDYYNTPHLRREIFERDRYKCYKCGKQLTQKTATLDHIQPVGDGGENTKDNLITCCLMCNSKRRNSDLSESL